MNLPPSVLRCLLLVCLFLCPIASAPAAERPAAQVDPSVRNDWPDAWEKAFQDEIDRLVEQAQPRVSKRRGRYGNTYFENEKASYAEAMMDFLAGYREPALKFLQGQDANASWHRHTEGIDYFACFTLKHQMRKYFLFGSHLDDEYRQRMKRGAEAWTEQDPLNRPHPSFKKFDPNQFTPEHRNSWVDTRQTDNLRWMRDTSVYLMAEETGNDSTRQLYKDKLIEHVRQMYDRGMGEWDSENYLGHSFVPWLNVYDFAKDRQVQLAAKAALDWMSAAAAVKYWRGGWNGPTKRDYYHPAAWRTPAAYDFGVYFDLGDAPQRIPFSHEHIHMITSAYRPPPATVALAKKQIPLPAELLISHPTYEHYKKATLEKPQDFETQYLSHSFMLGTLPRGSGGDTNGFKMLAFDSARGVDYIIAGSGSKPDRIVTSSNGKDNVAQFRNLAIFLNGDPSADIHFWLPTDAAIEQTEKAIFVRLEKTWLALLPIHLKWQGVNAAATETIQTKQKYPDDQILSARGTGEGAYTGFALEVGDAADGSFDDFKQAVTEKANLDLSKLAEGNVTYRGAGGGEVGLVYAADGLPRVFRDGQPHDWTNHYAPYQPAGGGAAPIHQAWQSGQIRVEAGGHVFEGKFDPKAGYTFTNTTTR
jgi:hypothetical protein